MTPENVEIEKLSKLVREAVASEFEERRRIDEETHRSQHEWIAAKIEKDRKRTETMEKVKATWLGWLVIAITSGIGVGAWNQFKKLLTQE